MHWFDWTKLEFYHYIAIGGGALLLVAIIAYFLPVRQVKIPAILLATVGGLAVGAALGVLGMAGLGYRTTRNVEGEQAANSGGGPAAGGRGGMGGMGGMMGGGVGRGQGPKTQLAQLVAKLDVLSGDKPLALNLSDEQKKKVFAQIKGLDEIDELKDEDAQERLKALLETVKDNKATLEQAGYRWPREGGQGGQGGRGGRGAGGRGGPPGGPGRGGPGGAEPAKNPFKDGENSKHLKALKSHLGSAV